MKQVFKWKNGLCLVFFLGIVGALKLGTTKQLYIVIDNAKLRKSILSFQPLQNIGSSAFGASVARQIYAWGMEDLKFTNYFDFVVPENFENKGYEIYQIPFNEWASLGTEFLIQGGYKLDRENLTVDIRLYDIKSAKLILGKTYLAKEKDAEVVAHRFANDVIETLTGQKGIFQSKIVFVSDKTRFSELYIMDFNGKNVKQLTYHRSQVMAPSWSSDGRWLAYSRYTTNSENIRNLDLFILELATGKERLVSSRPGLNSGAVWAPDGKSLICFLTFEGNAELYQLDLSGNIIRRLTFHDSVDVEPSFSPDGKRVVFSSSRKPAAHLYLLEDLSKREVTTLTFAGQHNSTPAWSPKGDRIAFAHRFNSQFDLFLINPNGLGLVRLTQSTYRKNNEQPSWSPDGRHIVFASNRSGKYGLYRIDPDGNEEVSLLLNFGNCHYPAWSPF